MWQKSFQKNIQYNNYNLLLSGLLNKNEKFSIFFWFKDLDTQKDLSVIELHTQINQNYELQKKKKKKLIK